MYYRSEVGEVVEDAGPLAPGGGQVVYVRLPGQDGADDVTTIITADQVEKVIDGSAPAPRRR